MGDRFGLKHKFNTIFAILSSPSETWSHSRWFRSSSLCLFQYQLTQILITVVYLLKNLYTKEEYGQKPSKGARWCQKTVVWCCSPLKSSAWKLQNSKNLVKGLGLRIREMEEWFAEMEEWIACQLLLGIEISLY